MCICWFFNILPLQCSQKKIGNIGTAIIASWICNASEQLLLQPGKIRNSLYHIKTATYVGSSRVIYWQSQQFWRETRHYYLPQIQSCKYSAKLHSSVYILDVICPTETDQISTLLNDIQTYFPPKVSYGFMLAYWQFYIIGTFHPFYRPRRPLGKVQV
jgi:hypothetical protein